MAKNKLAFQKFVSPFVIRVTHHTSKLDEYVTEKGKHTDPVSIEKSIVFKTKKPSIHNKESLNVFKPPRP